MTSLSFLKEHAPKILSGEKQHTIRAMRKHPIKANDPLELFTGLRTNKTVRLMNTHCTLAQTISIYSISQDQIFYDEDFRGFAPGDMCVELAGDRLSSSGIHALALADGFKNSDAFFCFFLTNDHWIERGNIGQLIHWAFPPSR